MSKTVAIQGEAASFHDVAARLLVGQNIALIPCETFEEVFACVVTGRADIGVAAVENSNFGPLAVVQRLLASQPVVQHSTVTIQIEQCLLGLPGTQIADITEVYSHFVALSQCSGYLKTHLPHATQVEHPDTAGSAADVRAWNNPTKAAIASRAAAALHGLAVVAAGIETDKDNRTRFVRFERP